MTDAFQRAIAAFQVGRLDLCKQCLHDALKEDPSDVSVIVYLANVHLCLDEFAPARSFSQNAIQLDPEHPGGYRVLAWATISDVHHCPGDPNFSPMTSDNRIGLAKRLEVARELTKRALEIDPENELNFGLLAEIEFLSDAPAEALKAAQRGLSYNPLSGACARAQIRGFDLLRDLPAAERAGLERLGVEPDDAACHHLLAMNYLQQRKLPAATRHAREAVRLDPDNESHRQTYWDAVKAKNPFFRPLVYWQFVVKRLSRLPEKFKMVCLIGFSVATGVLSIVLDKHMGFEGAPVVLIVCAFLIVWILGSERPCMSIVDLVMTLTDPHYRQIADTKALAKSTGTTFFVCAILFCFSLFAFKLYWPLGALLVAVLFFVSVGCLIHSQSWPWRLLLVLNMVAMGALLYFGVDSFQGSMPNSTERLLGMYYVMGFVFLSVAGPTLYIQVGCGLKDKLKSEF